MYAIELNEQIKTFDCPDCGKKLQDFEANSSYFQGRCGDCRKNYGACIRCGEIRLLEDMRQAYCVDCRRE